MKNFAIILACFGVFFAGGSIGYYYGFYLPNKSAQSQIMIEQGYQSAKNQNITDSVKCNKIFDKEASIGCMQYANEQKDLKNKRWTEDSEFTRDIKQKIEDFYAEKTRVKTEIDALGGKYSISNLLVAGEKIYGEPGIYNDMLYYIFGKNKDLKISEEIFVVCVYESIFSCDIRLPDNTNLYDTYLLQDVAIKVPYPSAELYNNTLDSIISSYQDYKNGNRSLKDIYEYWVNIFSMNP